MPPRTVWSTTLQHLSAPSEYRAIYAICIFRCCSECYKSSRRARSVRGQSADTAWTPRSVFMLVCPASPAPPGFHTFDEYFADGSFVRPHGRGQRCTRERRCGVALQDPPRTDGRECRVDRRPSAGWSDSWRCWSVLTPDVVICVGNAWSVRGQYAPTEKMTHLASHVVASSPGLQGLGARFFGREAATAYFDQTRHRFHSETGLSLDPCG